MQYSFDFSEKPATPNLNLNHLDYKQLSGFAEFTEQLINFNEKYDMNLVATKSSRWQPGTYDKIKANIDSIIYPHWKKRRGANSINKLLERNNWRYQNFQDELKTLDNKLYRYRKEGIELYTDDDLKKAKSLLYELLDKFTTEYDDVQISIEPVPHFGRSLRGYSHHHYNDSNSEKVARLYPAINQDNQVIGTYNLNMYESLDNYKQVLYDNSKEISPAKWFINIRVVLRDVHINVTNSNMKQQYEKFPYGDIIVCFTLDLVTLLSNYRRILNEQHLIKTEYVGIVAKGFPKYQGLEHPFIYTLRARNDINMVNYYNSYGSGNACLGALSDEIYYAIFQGNIKLLKSYLKIWASSYSVGATSPLNNISKSTFGVRREWDSNVRGLISGGSTTCQRQIQLYDTNEEKIEFAETFCAGCAINLGCKTYDKININKISWMDEANGNWIQAFNKLYMHLTNEIDSKIIYEIFADLHYFHTSGCKTSADKWNEYNIGLAFGCVDLNIDYNDFVSSINQFIEDGPTEDNIIKIFEMYYRNFTLHRVYNDSMKMYKELMKNTKGLSFDEATAKLTINDIENNHYSWLYAARYITSRNEYWTYIKMLKGRREGVRYAN